MKHPKSVYVFALLIPFCTIAVFNSGCSATKSELIPREVLFGNPVKARPRISPNGKMMAYLAPLDNVLNVWVKTIGRDDDKAVTKDKDRKITNYFWAKDSRHIMYLQDVGGNENWRLYAVDLETSQLKDITPYENVQVQIVARDKHFPNELLISMNKEDPKVHDVYHLDLTTGSLEMVAKNPGNIDSWLVDTDFNVHCATVLRDDGGVELMVRETKYAGWEKLLTWGPDDATMTSWPISFSKNGKSLYLVDSRNSNTGRLIRMEIKTGDIQVIAEDPQYDVGDVLIHPDSYEVQAVTFTKARTEWLVLDDSIKDDFKKISKLDHGDFFISDRDNADETWLLYFVKDNGSTSYYAYDRKKKKGTFLFDYMPELSKYKLARMEPISFTARDGLIIHGYITFPVGKQRKNLPMVLNVHGGPWGRDSWGYDSTAQWFANRGYICLQVNFRGSTGYGKAFVNAGDKEWGGKMHNDLVDAVNWAIKQGYADPKKIAIFGTSYGGYAALVGATFTPDLFCCAVDAFGCSNLVTWFKSIPPYWSTELAMFQKRVGDPETEEEFLKSRSPLFKVDQIKIPILIVHGANDPRVKQLESDQIVEAMKKKGLSYEYIVFEDEGHGFGKPENRIEFYAATEKFLAKYLGGRYEKSIEDSEK